MGWAGLDNWAKPRNFWLGRSRPNISFFLGQGSGPGLHGCWPNPTTMLINHAACRTRIRSARSNLVSSNEETALFDADRGLAGRDGERLAWGRWLRPWQRWWPVAEEAKEEEENGRGCREERETDGGSWWSVGGYVGFLWWSWWWRSWWCLWLVAGTAERERERKTAETGAEGLVFRRLWTPISPLLGHEMQPNL